MVISQTFGEWVRSRRKTLGLTREQLALRVGCSVSGLRKIEDDERRPSEQIAELIARGLGIPAQYSADFIRVARGEYGTERLAAVSDLIQRPAASPPLTTPHGNLPVFPTPLIGRQRELAELHQLLSDPQCHMLSLVGPGGMGKTRLAVEAASALQARYEDGVHFVALAPVDSSRFVLPVIANAIGFAFLGAASADPKSQLLNFLADKRMLLLVDNVEHLLQEPGIELFTEILGHAPNVKLLMTSREALDLQGEWIYEVRGLAVADEPHTDRAEQETSVELFLQRARRAHVGFNATTEDYPAIVRICRLVEGMPLAIELAAGWARTLSCEEIANEIQRSLDFLSASSRDLPARHRSVRAVFDHSWKLLSGDEQRALARLSVFRGGFERQAAERVAGATLPMLAALVAKSLVRRPEAGRYDLHDLIRQYAALHLEADPAETVAARQEHYAFYLAFAETTAPQLKSSRQLECLRLLEQEHDNFRAALAWSLVNDDGGLEGQNMSAVRLAGTLRWFWKMRGYFDEGRTWLIKALEQGPQGPLSSPAVPVPASPVATSRPADRQAQARALEALGALYASAGNLAAARMLAEQSESISRELTDKNGLANALMMLGEVLRWQGDATLSYTRLQEALALYREVGDRWGTARCLFRMGQYLTSFAGNAAGQAMLEESSNILEELRDTFIQVGVLAVRGIVAVNTSGYASARSYLERSLSMARKINDPWGAAEALTNLGDILRIQGDYQAARSQLEVALKLYQQGGRGTWLAGELCALAENEIALGRLAAARSYLHEALAGSETSGNRWLQVLVGNVDGLLSYYEGDNPRAVTLLEGAAARAGEGEYRLDLARALVSLGRALRASGESGRAIESLTEGLRLFWESGNKLGIATALEAFAELLTSEAAERAAQFLGAADTIRSAIGAPLPPIDRPGYERTVAIARGYLGDAGFEAAAARGRSEPYQVFVGGILASLDSPK